MSSQHASSLHLETSQFLCKVMTHVTVNIEFCGYYMSSIAEESFLKIGWGCVSCPKQSLCVYDLKESLVYLILFDEDVNGFPTKVHFKI